MLIMKKLEVGYMKTLYYLWIFFLASKSILKREIIKKKKKEEADGSAQLYFGHDRKPYHQGSIWAKKKGEEDLLDRQKRKML